ncbi:pyruvate kinase [Mollicutes bacterium LVI A0039]|nr:pyruvate kinase [Mollicutes bacterium LVI A0039]
MKNTKLVATIGPASSSKEVLQSLVENGLNVMRLNMSHGPYDEQQEKIDLIREINQEIGSNVAILLDTKGPEVRTGEFEDGTFLEKGQTATIVVDEIVGNTEKFTVSYKELYKDLKPGNIILLDDGYVSVEVTEISGTDIIVKVLNTGRMKSRRGVNVPGVTLSFDFMSPKDKADIEWACDQDLDFIAASFVRNAQDLKEIKSVLEAKGNTHIQIISKIESQDGVENIDEIIELSDGIMVARGDLGVEVPAEDVPVIQKMIIEKCNKLGKMVVTATQMLESMQDNPRPTRAEVSDVFNAVMDGTDAVMLSGESASGQYPLESVQMQSKIAEKAEGSFNYDHHARQQYKNLAKTVTESVAYSTVAAANTLEEIKLVIAITESGNTARVISRLKPQNPILALTSNEKTRRSLALSYGVTAEMIEKNESTTALIADAVEIAKAKGLVVAGDEIAISAGSINEEGKTDLMRIVTVK